MISGSWNPDLLPRGCFKGTGSTSESQQSWFDSSISEEVAEHTGASCLMKQVAAVIKNPVLPNRFEQDSNYSSFYSQKGHPCYMSRMMRKPWPSSSKVTQHFGDLAETRAWTAWLRTNTDWDSAISFLALQNEPQNYSKCNQTEGREQRLICRIEDLAGICDNVKAGSVQIVPFEWDRLKH